MVLLLFFLVFSGVMLCGHYLSGLRYHHDDSRYAPDRPLKALLDYGLQPHTCDSIDTPEIAKKG
ncbi:hypothetical protein [Alcanivorax sp.]|uniref:hypothetical protein n=1 Tax=Alcanivorax sp. TaxID=1872427 RepID=UPI002440809E|nr:hypothetical protein [Alcanivorax sp.]